MTLLGAFVLFLLFVITTQNKTIQSQKALILLQQQDSNALTACQLELNRRGQR